MNPDPATLRQLAANAADQRHRFLLVLAGPHAWCYALAQYAVDLLSREALWIGDEAPPGAPRLKGAAVQRLLGTEREVVVFDAHAGMDVEAFGAVSGSVRAGGGLILLVPPLADWPRYADPENGRITVHPVDPAALSGRFLARFACRIRAGSGIVLLEQGGELPSLPSPALIPPDDHPAPPPYRTLDQQRAVAAIHQTASALHPHPLVLRSDRGRGKSAALGIAAAERIRAGAQRILVTAPRFDAAEMLFMHAEQGLPQGRRTREGFHYRGALLRFMPPDALAAEAPEADLVLVDEAAAIPTPLLARLLARYPRIVFATTVHGYEGTGRGFDVRFRRHLDRHAPGWRLLSLEIPVRWGPGDPLERFVFDALLLDAAPVADEVALGADAEGCLIARLDRDRLAADEPLLRHLFGLLVLAHYRTSPLDLRHLLDGPNLRVYAMTFHGDLVGAALVAREGGFEPELARASADGIRRPRGHLLPQTLAFHGGMEEAPRLIADRIVRIAIHPAAQGRGLGSRLLNAIAEASAAEGVDYLGSSFGATPDLPRFWLRAGFVPVRVGSTREASSGAHALVVVRGITAAGHALGSEAARRLRRDMALLLRDPLRDLDSVIVDLPGSPMEESASDGVEPRDWRLLAGFAWGHRDYETVVAPLFRLVRGSVERAHLTEAERALLLAKVTEARSWSEVVERFGLGGRGDLLQRLRSATAKLLDHAGVTEVADEKRRLAASRPKP